MIKKTLKRTKKYNKCYLKGMFVYLKVKLLMELLKLRCNFASI